MSVSVLNNNLHSKQVGSNEVSRQWYESSQNSDVRQIMSTASVYLGLSGKQAHICHGYNWCSCSWFHLDHQLHSTFCRARFHLQPYLRNVKIIVCKPVMSFLLCIYCPIFGGGYQMEIFENSIKTAFLPIIRIGNLNKEDIQLKSGIKKSLQ